MTSPAPLRIDFVSDVACPWCAVGLASLQQALAKLDGAVHADIHLQPFELNPQMAAEGEDAGEHIMRKYGIDEARMDANRAAIRERAAALGSASAPRRSASPTTCTAAAASGTPSMRTGCCTGPDCRTTHARWR
jgi:Predicted dithiol-disulfide isomerase involved in polyketide biosynthesis